MIRIDELTGIPKNIRNKAIECLDDLITSHDEKGQISPIITGYNWYKCVSRSERIITFSHIHESEEYKEDMLIDLDKLGYSPDILPRQIREKTGVFLWDPSFNIRKDNGELLPGLRIKDIRNQRYIELERFTGPLGQYEEFIESEDCLLAEDSGWELDIPFNNKEELMKLVNLFHDKSGKHAYDSEGHIIIETPDEKALRGPWRDAYRTPILILGSAAVEYASNLPQFIPATRISFTMNSNEISFVIHKNLERLQSSQQYEELMSTGFQEESCLGNRAFIETYVDKER